MSISLRQLQAFVAVVENGSFIQAAQELHLTQSALSGLIKELETRLDMRLIDRTTRQLALSESGRLLLPHAKRILNEYAAFSDVAQTLKNGSIGQVRYAVSQQLAASIMPSLIGRFAREQPDIYVQLIDCSVEQVLQAVQNADVDFGIGPERDLPEDIQAELLFELPFYAALPADHPLAAQTAVDWQDLQGWPVITLRGHFTERLADSLPEQVVALIHPPAHSVNFLSTALGMVRAGLGITLCLPYAADWVKNHDLVLRPLVQPAVTRRFFIYRKKNRSLSAPAETFHRFLSSCTPDAWSAPLGAVL